MDIKQANLVPMLALQAIGAVIDGPAVDLRDFDHEGQVVLSVDVGTTGVLDVLFEEADAPGGPWTGASLAPFDQVTDTSFVQMAPIVPSEHKRYLRATAQWASGAFTGCVNLVAPLKFGRNATQRTDT